MVADRWYSGAAGRGPRLTTLAHHHPAPRPRDDPTRAMHPTDPKPPADPFQEGMDAREAGLSIHDNPYAAGSAKRREWQAGFCATVQAEDEDAAPLDPNDGPKRRTSY